MSQSTDTYMYSLEQLSTLLVKENRIHEGHYEPFFEFQFAAGAIGPNEQEILPGIMLGVKSVGIRKVDTPTPLSIDAAMVNPAPEKKPRARTKTA